MHYFAYGSNMNRGLMRRRCPGAVALGRARLDGWRFVITADGYASVVPAAGGRVHGVLWRLTPRDRAALNRYESLDSGLYTVLHLLIQGPARRLAALVYVGRRRTPGRPRPGYLAPVLAGAREFGLPEDYVRALARWSPSRWRGARAPDVGDVA
jgi:cation transport regulator ChaC